MATIFNGCKLSALEIKTAGLSLDKSTTLLCVGAEKRADYTGCTKIVLRVMTGQNTLNIYTEAHPRNEERYQNLRQQLHEKYVVPVRIPSVTISAYCHTKQVRSKIYGLKLSCEYFQLINETDD